MASQQPDPKIAALADALGELRDSWVNMSIVLKDHFAEIPSPERDQIKVQIERHIARIKEGQRGPFE